MLQSTSGVSVAWCRRHSRGGTGPATNGDRPSSAKVGGEEAKGILYDPLAVRVGD